MPRFQLIAVSPAGFIDPAIPIAAGRAGGMGILDLEFMGEQSERVRQAIARLARYTQRGCGLKLDAADVERFFSRVVPDLPRQVEVVVLAAYRLEDLKTSVRICRDHKISIFVEVKSLEEAHLAAGAGANGLVAKGNESGGWVGQETSFILVQQLVRRFKLPVWVQGGIGLHSASGCYAAGAAGVVLDGQLLLTRESPLGDDARAVIFRMDGSQTACLGEELQRPFRVYARPDLALVKGLSHEAGVLARDSRPCTEVLNDWQKAVCSKVGGDDMEMNLWPLSQDAAFAKSLAERFCTVGGIFAAIRQATDEDIGFARSHMPLGKNSPLARSHGTRYPIVQGPMTWVSDRPAFIAKVAEAGGLPFLGVGLMHAEALSEILEKTQALLGELPWGVGILGFLPRELREEQFETIRKHRPQFALVSGGRPDLVRTLEQEGMVTYVHVPSVDLLDMFLSAGVRRFVFEGREGGGHVGPRSSFMLWNTMVDRLLDALPDKDLADCHVLFAGGIHDDVSSGMTAALAAPLAKRGVRVGVLLGTAYLFTLEAVDTGAIVRGFHEAAVKCGRTMLLASSPGHAVRCAITPYAERFNEEKQRLVTEGKSPEDIRKHLEEMNLGRLRIASRGIKRNPEYGRQPGAQKYIKVGDEEQRDEGLFMIGQVAALRDEACTMEQLHTEISDQGSRRLAGLEDPHLSAGSARPTEGPCDIAIIGMACLMPKAGGIQTYWENILNKVNAITEIPEDRWDWRLYYDPERSARDKTYSKWGGFLDDIPFQPTDYGIPPNALACIEPLHLLTLETVRAALKDAGYSDRPFERERTSIIMGIASAMPDMAQQYVLSASMPLLFQEVPPEAWDRLPEWTEDSFPGILTNVTAGRVANRFDLGGVSFTIDAACASSLAALQAAIRQLEKGDSDMAIVGGADTSQNPWMYLCFSKINALSPTGETRTFDETADGIVISEGIGMVVLKRRVDAERDGDRIYAVVRGVGGSSDGRGRGLTAPRLEGQILALKRAYDKAGFPPDAVDLIEAHGTGTVAGDKAEIAALKAVFESGDQTGRKCALGSVKSMIGHTKAAAGVASLIKTALALYHKVLPPTIGVAKPNPALEGSRLYVNTEVRPWIGRSDGQPRRAGVSAFGFGGTNFHGILEEYVGGITNKNATSVLEQWPAELFVWSYGSQDELKERLDVVHQALAAGIEPRMQDLAYSLWEESKGRSGQRLAVVATSLTDLRKKLARVSRTLNDAASATSVHIWDPRGIYLPEKPLGPEAKVAFLFPGQGAQYADMLNDLAVSFPEIRQAFERAENVLADLLERPLSTYIFPEPFLDTAAQQSLQKSLDQSNVTHPAIGAACMGLFALLRNLGITPDMVAGHSYGEWIALSAAGAFEDTFFYRLSESPGRFVMEASEDGNLGAMVAVGASPEDIDQDVQAMEGVWIANRNSPTQTIVAGSQSGIAEAVGFFATRGIRTKILEVGCAFHSPLVASVQKRLTDEFFSTITYSTPQVEVFSNTTAAPYPRDSKGILSILSEHFIRPVCFIEEIEAMYEAGARIFVEVGPGHILTNRTREILAKRPHLSVAMDRPGESGLLHLQQTLGQLVAHGVQVRLDHLYQGRRVEKVQLDVLADQVGKRDLSPMTWMVNGGYARPFGGEKRSPLTLLSLGTADNLRSQFNRPYPGAEGKSEMAQEFSTKCSSGIKYGHADEVARFQKSMIKMADQFFEKQNAVMQACLRRQDKGSD